MVQEVRILPGTPLIIDDDLLFEEDGKERPSSLVNSYIISRSHEPRTSMRTLEIYVDALLAWLVFLDRIGTDLVSTRDELKAALGVYAEFQLSGKDKRRWANSTWNLNVTAISEFYKWAREEELAGATPFTYSSTMVLRNEVPVPALRNNAKLAVPKGHSTIKYLGREYQHILINTLEGMSPDGGCEIPTKRRHLSRNTVLARLMIASGLRNQELTYLTPFELPHSPKEKTEMPIMFAIPGTITKRGKPRTTWIDFDTLIQAEEYIRWERKIAAQDSSWLPKPGQGKPLFVECPDSLGATIGGERRSWSDVTLDERARLVSPEGGSCLLGLQSNGAPFRALGTVLRRVAARITERVDPKFPHVRPHMLRHTFAMNTLELLVRGYYDSVSKLSSHTQHNPALALYMTRQDPIMVLRDLLGHSSVSTTQLYLDRLDARRIYSDAFKSANLAHEDVSRSELDEVSAEFSEDCP